MARDEKLSDLQKYVIYHNGTEKPFENQYWNHKEEGIYVDVVSGKALFSSTDKFDSGTGWPSFYRPIEDAVTQKDDNSHGMKRTEVRSKNSDIHLGHVFDDGPKDQGGKRYCINSAALKFIAKNDLVQEGYGKYLKLFENKSLEKAIVAGGCFWGMEELISKYDGVIDVVNGYSGGHIPNPTYEIVRTGLSGHAESVEITFNPEKVSYEQILRFFFQIHDPTTLNRQGNDIGSQYRSAIFYLDDRQKIIAADLITKANNSGVFDADIVTSLEKFNGFYKAEEYHQDYLERNPNGYTCHAIRDNWKF